eukprot:493895_1
MTGFLAFCVITDIYVAYKDLSGKQNSSINITNPMVIFLGIQNYETKPTNAEFNEHCQDLECAENDVYNSRILFETILNYQCYSLCYNDNSNYPKLKLQKQEILEWIRKHANIFHHNVENGKCDGLIVAITARGCNENIITSDYGLIATHEIHAIFSHYQIASTRTVPRVFLFNLSGVDDEYDRSYACTAKNPRYKQAMMQAANIPFQAKLHQDIGSYFTYELVSKINQALDDGVVRSLGEIFKEVQTNLEENGKEFPFAIFNNSTENVRFIENTSNCRFTIPSEDQIKELETLEIKTETKKVDQYDIRNPMVIIIVIGEYIDNDDAYDDVERCDDVSIDMHCPNIANNMDVINLYSLFEEKLHYQCYPKMNWIDDHSQKENIYWSKKEILQLMRHQSEIFAYNVAVGKCDGLFVAISSCGDGSIITSDYGVITKDELCSIFSRYVIAREAPRIFLFDIGEGSAEYGGKTWKIGAINPDHNVAIIKAANKCFQPEMKKFIGSHLINEFVGDLIIGLTGRNTPCIGEIFKGIHWKLGTVHSFNNESENVAFCANESDEKFETTIDDYQLIIDYDHDSDDSD